MAILVGACGDNHATSDGASDTAPGIDAPQLEPEPDADPLEPNDLMGTGLCLDATCATISPDVVTYTPRFPLWSDGATKRRWMYLPPGTKIDDSDPDHWVFPQGTKFWKEFTVDGVRVETRYIAKVGAAEAPGSWFYIAYQWNTDMNATTAVPMGVQNADGTQHDIPSRQDCKTCHEDLTPGRVLGFQAIQLDTATPVGLDDLVAMDLLTNPTLPDVGAHDEHYPIPGNDITRAALGYMHVNCGHCHNDSSVIASETPLRLRLDTLHLDQVTDTPAYATTVNQIGSQIMENNMTYQTIVIPQEPDDSVLILRMNDPNPQIHMPNLGSEVVDPDGQVAIRAWINQL
ncbi:MAG TPA: hypothetical protein VGM88_17545 [Kofleriaceae bacterium]